MDLARLAERVWYGDDVAAGVARAALAPLSMLFRAGVATRGALYDRGLSATHALPLPAISVGNLTVGGTGKTPVAAWIARTLRERGARPAIVLRGVGDDESRVHALLNPDVPVVVAPDRVAGTEQARALGADVVVLDDAFQHRRAARTVDLVLLAAERGLRHARLLPAGPYREGLDALGRASVVVVTRKSTSRAEADALLAALAARAPGAGHALVHLAPHELRAWEDHAGTAERGGAADVTALAGARVLAVSGIGDPRAFESQLRAAGAEVVTAAFADHHAYTAADVDTLVARARAVDRVVCTLKDAVKLGPLWPRGAPTLWYVSQRVTVERGERVLEDSLGRLLAART
ncbi:tetraacyldisaccharide 4'-kinase [Roseisolibacter agri]|uniref:Tetraacyldisaccharide 4'-kinase n=1 Tax=Roseisolibacter agri TaxID=2014610 RepID=A0AA37QIL6_9BACT|nr:tetraacyldisaccharide 4'-kinase [Roseisolibacter agri]GLC27195.1 tetraacyldisaccharide 4'-kinase [Roseisolibacter agri]